MRTIEWTGQFKRDYRREKKGRHRASLDRDLFPLIERLAKDENLEPRHVDHPLAGEWKDHRDCHIRPDLVLIYRKVADDCIALVRLGSHSELGL
jgi:mRNA interferase YafQ